MLTTATDPHTRASAGAEASEVHKTYGHGDQIVRALDGVTVRFHSGSFSAVMGPSGSGKSTLMHALGGVDTVDAGSVVVGGVDLTALNEHQRTLLRRDHIGFVFQSFNLIPTLTARENITLPIELARGRVDPAWFERLVRLLRLEDRLEHTPRELSGGQQQRVAVARALIAQPALVLADEPTGNLDSGASAELLSFFRVAVEELNQTVVMVTHDPLAASYSDRVVFLADGRIVDEMVAPTVDAVLGSMKKLDARRKS